MAIAFSRLFRRSRMRVSVERLTLEMFDDRRRRVPGAQRLCGPARNVEKHGALRGRRRRHEREFFELLLLFTRCYRHQKKKKKCEPLSAAAYGTATVHFTVPFYPPRDFIDCIWLPASMITTHYENFLQSKWKIKAFPMVNGLLWLTDLETWVFVIRDFKCVESCPVNTTQNVLYNSTLRIQIIFR